MIENDFGPPKKNNQTRVRTRIREFIVIALLMVVLIVILSSIF